MSGSYFNLLSKYNTLYSLFLKVQNGSATDLSGVLTNGNTADDSIILDNAIQDSTLSPTNLIFNNGQLVGDYGTEISLENINSQINIDPSNGLVITNGANISHYKNLEMKLDDSQYSNNITQNDVYLYDNINGISMTLNRLKIDFEYNGLAQGLYNVISSLTSVLDLSCNELTLNGAIGAYGDVFISGGNGPPEFEPITNLICHGTIASPGLTGTLVFSDVGSIFIYTPTVILTVVSGDTTTYIAVLVSVTNLQFTYQISGLGASSLSYIVL